ncbi:hypothetical protein CAL7102_06024 [Dulcicalothrix desertica PCC 7102]|nr:hypothetical protein CAL7102_06024 [Dulcicalothrix desertica PCC 7102]
MKGLNQAPTTTYYNALHAYRCFVIGEWQMREYRCTRNAADKLKIQSSFMSAGNLNVNGVFPYVYV